MNAPNSADVLHIPLTLRRDLALERKSKNFNYQGATKKKKPRLLQMQMHNFISEQLVLHTVA
jgi:hypothetical protein